MRRPLLLIAAVCCLAGLPATAEGPVRVMAFGDSLTKGTGSTHGAGYRLEFLKRMEGAGYQVDMLGSFHAGPKEIDRDHQGHQGQGVAKLDEVSWDELRRERPDVVLLLIGTNDAKASFVPDGFRIRYSVLLDRILAESHTKLVASTIPPVRYGKRETVIEPLNAIIRSEVEKRQAQGKSVRLVDAHELIDPRADFVDSLHPNDAGYARLGDAFADTLIGMLPPPSAAAAAAAPTAP